MRLAGAGAALLGALLAASPALGDEAGVDAFERGEFERARELLEPAARSGDVGAMTLVANLYRTGRGVARDYATAARWYRRLADLGHPVGLYNLAVHYREGLGVGADDAAATGHFLAAARLGLRPRTDRDAPEWLRRASAQSILAAQINVGLRYADGAGIERDVVRGYAWLHKAAGRGSSAARGKRDALGARMTEAQVEEATRLAYSLR